MAFILVAITIYTYGRVSTRPIRRTRTQHEFKTGSASLAQPERLKAVKREFVHAWTGYKDHAWTSDMLLPVSGIGTKQFCGWSATIIDSLDTLWIMDLKDEFSEAIDVVLAINFTESAASC